VTELRAESIDALRDARALLAAVHAGDDEAAGIVRDNLADPAATAVIMAEICEACCAALGLRILAVLDYSLREKGLQPG
jgi:hypothetical protein